MEVYLFKLNGWPDTFNERVSHLSDAVDSLVVIRSKPPENDGLNEMENITVYDVAPRRGSFVEPSWAKPFVFALHVFQAVLFALLAMRKRGRKPDALHAIDYVIGGSAALATNALSGVPFVLSVRGLKEPAYRNMVEEEGGVVSKVKYRILVTLSGVIIPRADYIVTKAAYQRDFVRETYDHDPGFVTAPTGVDFGTFDPEGTYDDQVFDRLFENDPDLANHTVVLFLGKLIPRKGVDRLLELVNDTADELPDDVRFAFIGEFRDPQFERKVRALGDRAGDRVLLHDNRVPFEDVPSFLAAADAVSLFSEPANEGVPRILQEAVAVGTPILASDVTGISRAFTGIEGCVLIDRDDRDAFQEVIERIADDSLRVDPEPVRERFDIRHNYARYREAYDAVSTRR